MMLAERRRAWASGYTLVETLVVTGILATIVALTAGFIAAGTRVFSRETRAVELQGDLAGSVGVLLDDLSIAGYGVASTSNPFVDVVVTGGLDSVEFQGDVDSDGAADRICYSVSSGALVRSVQPAASACGANTPQTLASNVQSFNLTFLGQTAANGTTRATLAETEIETAGKRCASAPPSGPCYVQVQLTAQASAKGGNVTKTITGESAVRN